MSLFNSGSIFRFDKKSRRKEKKKKVAPRMSNFEKLNDGISIQLEDTDEEDALYEPGVSPRSSRSKCKTCLVQRCDVCHMCTWMSIIASFMVAFFVLFVVFVAFYARDHPVTPNNSDPTPDYNTPQSSPSPDASEPWDFGDTPQHFEAPATPTPKSPPESVPVVLK